MDAESICKSRHIDKVEIETPLLIPSFSSAVLEKVSEIHERLRDHIPTASLVSAYDLNYDLIDKESIWASEIVFIDSGNFEVVQLADSKKLREWSPSMHMKVVDSLKPLTKVALVNYDMKEQLKTQISRALDLFARYPGYGTCFLCKPSLESRSQIDIKGLIENIALIDSFNILALTEKELGDSLLKRCQNLLEIRKALDSHEIDIPIHIFGCLDPLGILLYFLCGADIFDGTLWQKFSFHENTAIYINNHVILSGNWTESDSSIRALTYVLNLRDLTHLMYNMRRYTRERDLDAFKFSEQILEKIKDLTGLIGLDIR